MSIPLLFALLAFLTVLTWVGIVTAEKENHAGWGVMGMLAHALSYAVLVQIVLLP